MKRKLEMLVPAVSLVLSAVLFLGVAATAVAASSPATTTGTHSHVTDTTAVLHGTINPNGSTTTYYFEWGLTTAYGVNSVAHSAGHGTKPVAVSTTATALIPGTVYHYRLVAGNGAGSSTGADHMFKTAGNPPPGVSTGPATQIGKNNATLTAVVSPNQQATTYFFEYGTTTGYGSQTAEATVPAGTAPVTVTASVQGLEAQTIFHYRIVALHNNTLEQPGADGSFMTLPLHRRDAAHPRYDEAAPRRARAVCTQHDRIGARTVLDPGGLRLPRERLDPLPARLAPDRDDARAART